MRVNIKLINTNYFIAVILLLSLMSSCSKKHDNSNSLGEKMELTLEVGGIIPAEENFEIEPLAAFNEEENTSMATKSFSKDNFVFDITSSQEAIRNTNTTDNATPEATVDQRNLRAAKITSMDNGIKYRFLLYNKNTNKCEASILSKSGTIDRINVIEGQQYNWYAYSFNSTDDISAPDENNPVLTTKTDRPLLYASGTISPITGSNSIAINFTHKLTQLSVKLDSRGMSGDISKVTANFNANYLKTSSFDIRTGKKTGTMTAQNVGVLTFEDLNPGSANIKVAKNYYTADESLTNFDVKITDLEIKYINNKVESVSSRLPNAGLVRFSTFRAPNAGNILMGNLKLWLVLPEMRIVTFSNSTNLGYKLEAGTASGNFIRSTYNFGPNSKYVKVKQLQIETITYSNANNIRDLLANPANYPDVLFIANHVNYLSDEGWNAVRRYLDAGGNVFYTQDNSTDAYADRFLSNLLGQTVQARRVAEDYCVYKFTNTLEAEQDLNILNGVFGDVRSYHWGQDRVGTVYVQGYTGNNAIVYTNKSQDKAAPSTPGMAFFRHKTKNFFFVGDGGFCANPNASGDPGSSIWGEYPFRTKGGTGTDKDFPVVSMYGLAAQAGSPTYFAPHKGASVGTYPMANSMMFGNILAWMFQQATFYPVKRS